MKVTKYGHACVLIEQGTVRILIDPGMWSSVPALTELDVVLITHEHFDHIDIETIETLVEQNPNVVIFTNDQVGKILKEKKLSYTRLQDGDTTEVQGIVVQGIGTKHDIVYGPSSPCENTGYLINNEFFFPGDALSVVPTTQVRVLALPTGGPWMKFSEAIDYAKKLKPALVFPVHDALYTEEVRRGLVPRVIGTHLESAGIVFKDLKDTETIEV
ncbi:MAG: MBL fold metallo-hydrolase [Patescibacteria group bacterium]|mgnify:CR=1 FL=1